MEEIITIGGGCFWCIEAIMERLRGVTKVESGYAGGTVENPTYRQVCTGTTGHAEVVQVSFDPEQVSLHDLLTVFFTLHDPTTPNQQGADVGEQYRSIVLYRTPEQKTAIEKVIAEITAQKIWSKPIVTQVVPFEVFYPAEEEHKQYYDRNKEQSYCRIVIDPKVAKLRKLYQDKLKKD